MGALLEKLEKEEIQEIIFSQDLTFVVTLDTHSSLHKTDIHPIISTELVKEAKDHKTRILFLPIEKPFNWINALFYIPIGIYAWRFISNFFGLNRGSGSMGPMGPMGPFGPMGGNGGLGQGYNQTRTDGATGTVGTTGGCQTYGGDGDTGETGGNGGDWGSSGGNTENTGAGGSAARAITGSNYSVTGTINSATIKGAYQP